LYDDDLLGFRIITQACSKENYLNRYKLKFLPFVLLVLSASCFSQKKLPVIKASSIAATITEDGQPGTKWNLSPQTKIDTYTTNKLTKPVTVRFVTDIDSISLKIKPGEHSDFMVLINGRDTCYTRFQSPAVKNYSRIKPVIHDTIALILNGHNTIYIKAVLNRTDTLNLNFDTGTTQLVLTGKVLKSRIKPELKLYNTPYELKIGNRVYNAKVYDTELTGHDTDGRFGWDIFDGLIVELNYDKQAMIVHSELPRRVKKDKAYTKLGIKYFSQLFFVESTMSQSGAKSTEWFLFDTGYQRTAMLDNDLLKQNNFPADKMKVIKKVMMHGATGNEVPVITSNLEALTLGKYTLNNVPAQLLTTSKPLRSANVHLLGNEVLKRFNILLDFQDNQVYLKPNHLYNCEYVDRE
jgi:hypothetical protein